MKLRKRDLDNVDKSIKDILPKDRELQVINDYPESRCIVEGCKRKAVGRDDKCKKHGGDPVVMENLLKEKNVPSHLIRVRRYKPDIHPKLFVKFAQEGKSEVEIAAEFRVTVRMIQEWAETYERFNHAYELGQALYEAWWLKEGVRNLDNRNYNNTMFKYLTGNKLGYSDKVESKSLIVHAGVLQVPGTVTEEEWEEAHVISKDKV